MAVVRRKRQDISFITLREDQITLFEMSVSELIRHRICYFKVQKVEAYFFMLTGVIGLSCFSLELML